MKKTTVIASILALSRIAMAQTPALMNDGAGLFIAPGAQVQVNGDFNNEVGSNLKNNGTIVTSGNVNNSVAMTAADAGELVLKGTAQQTFGGAMTYATNVTVSNAAGVMLMAPLEISGQVNFVSGIVTNNDPANAVIFTSTATTSATNPPSHASHINGFAGKLGTGAFTFPIGDEQSYQPIAVNLTANAQGLMAKYETGDAGDGPFTTTGSSPTALVARNQQEYWTLTPTTTATGSATLFWDDYNNTGIASLADLTVAHYTNSSWQNEGAVGRTGNVAAGSVTSNVISDWSPFTLGSTAISSPLPVRLVSFAATKAESVAELSWRVADAVNFSHFEIERSSDAVKFEHIGRVDYAGAAGLLQEYRFTDPGFMLPAGTRYYRLRMVDNDGASALSKMVSLNFDDSALHFSAFPNPSRDKLTLQIDGNLSSSIEILVTSTDGRQMIRKQAKLVQGSTVVDTAGLPSGVYLLSTNVAGRTSVLKFAKQ